MVEIRTKPDKSTFCSLLYDGVRYDCLAFTCLAETSTLSSCLWDVPCDMPEPIVRAT